MSIDFLNMALNGTQNTFPLPTFCKRSRLRKSNCRRCMEICPENAIVLDPGPTIKDGCSDCGLCQRICPTEAFENELSTDEDLLNQGKSFLDREKSQLKKKTLFISCRQAENQDEESISVPCLGKITENVILGAALLGFAEVVLIKGICSQCHFTQGEKLLANSITLSRILLESSGLGIFPVRLQEKVKKKERILSRREIFSKISNEVGKKASSYLHDKGGAFQKKVGGIPEWKDGKRSSPRRRLLQTLIRKRGWEKSVVLKYRPEFPWGRIKIDEKNCSACGTCLALCPTGSISKKLEEGYQFFCHNSSLCSNCSLCKEACPRNAIDFEADFPLTDIFEDEVKVVARVKLTSCIVCGEVMTAEKGNLCFTCQKRKVWPIHVNV